jgi:hypothetical protein
LATHFSEGESSHSLVLERKKSTLPLSSVKVYFLFLNFKTEQNISLVVGLKVEEGVLQKKGTFTEARS